MVRGMKAIDTGGGITVPVGEGTLGRVMNVIGEPVDNLGPVKATERYPIHRHLPTRGTAKQANLCRPEQRLIRR